MRFEPLNPSQRRALVIVILLAAGALAVRLTLNPAHIPATPPEPAPLAHTLQTKLDIKTAPWEHLAAIPGLGETKARAIVAYRDQRRAANPSTQPFAKIEDLDPIPGIGPATLDLLAKYVSFAPPPS